MSEKKNKCDKKCEVYSRVVGYYRPIDAWNKGKREEYSKRKTFKVKGEGNDRDDS